MPPLMLAATHPVPPNPPPDPVPPGDPFIYQTPGYAPAVDGIGAFGANSGYGFRPASGGAPNWYFITTNSSNPATGSLVDTRTYECSLPYACAHDVSNKVIIDLTSGAKDFTTQELDLRGDNVSLVGHTVRAGTGYGGYIRSRLALYGRGSNVHIQGLRFFQDSGGSDPVGNQRDNVTFGTGSTHLVSGCEFHGGIDECLSFYDTNTVCSVVESAICSPMEGTAISEVVGHNLGTIVGYSNGSFSMLRCAHFHAFERHPLSYCRYNGIANCLVYNPADGHGNQSQGLQISRHGSDANTFARYASIINSLFLRGPQGYTGNLWPINSPSNYGAVPMAAGTQIHSSGNRHMNYAGVTGSDQSTFLGNQADFDARQWYSASAPSGSMPSAWGANGEYIDSITDSTAGYLAFIAKLRAACGVQPKDPGITVLSDHFTQAENYVNTTGSGYGAVASSQSYPSATTFTIVPSNSSHVTAYWGGNSLPAVATRDNVNANGVSEGEAWARLIRRVHYGT